VSDTSALSSLLFFISFFLLLSLTGILLFFRLYKRKKGAGNEKSPAIEALGTQKLKKIEVKKTFQKEGPINYVKQTREITEKDPSITAMVIKKWLSEEEIDRKQIVQRSKFPS